MKYRYLPRLVSMLAVWLLLVLWQWSAVRVGPLGNLAFVLVVSVPLAMSGIEAAFYRRHAFREQYLLPGSALFRLTSRAPLLVLTEVAKALALGLVLMAGTLSFGLREWMLLLLMVLVLSFLMPRLPGLLRDSVRPVYLYPMARRWAVWVCALMLWGEAVLMLALVDDSTYRGLAWAEVVGYTQTLPTRPGAEGLVAWMQRLDAGAQGAAVWARDLLVHGGARAAAGPTAGATAGDTGAGVCGTMVGFADTLIAWLVLPAVAMLWFLIAWAFSRALVGVTARPRAIWAPRDRPHAGHYEPWWY